MNTLIIKLRRNKKDNESDFLILRSEKGNVKTEGIHSAVKVVVLLTAEAHDMQLD